MKILYVYETMPGLYQKYLQNLFLLLKSTLNIKSFVYKKSESKSDYYIVTYGLRDYFQRLLFKLKLAKYKSADLLIFSKFDIIHIQHSYLFDKIRPLLVKSNKIKIVITLRGGDTYLKPWLDERWKKFYSDEGNLIDAFITVSQNQKEYLTKWGVVEDKIHVIPVSFGHYSSAKPKYPNKLKLKLVSAFRMTWEKNIQASIEFAKRLKDQHIDFQYDIYGSGRDIGQLYYLVDKYNLKEHVFIKGKLKNEDLKKELVNYDFFLQLSLSEALSVSVVEAQSLGLPCIVSDSGGLPEAVIKGETSIVYSYKDMDILVDETLKLWNNSELYYQFSQNAIEFVNHNFTLNHEKEKLTKLYKSLI